MPLPKTFSSLALAALLSACTPDTSSAPPEPPATHASGMDQALMKIFAQELSVDDWNFDSAYGPQGQRLPDWQLSDRPVLRLHMGAGQLKVLNLCNAIGASYQLTGTHSMDFARIAEKSYMAGSYGIKVSLDAMTERLCPEPDLMALERRVAAQLPMAEKIESARPLANNVPMRLLLRFADGTHWVFTGPVPSAHAPNQILMAFDMNLSAYLWEPDSTDDQHRQSPQDRQPPNPQALQMQFDAGRLTVTTSCNVISASYTLTNEGFTRGIAHGVKANYRLSGQNVKISEDVTTKRLCVDSETKSWEQHMTMRLPFARHLELAQPISSKIAADLTLTFSDGTHLKLKGNPRPSSAPNAPSQ